MTITYDQFAWALLPWIIAIAFMFLAIIGALIVDDGKRADRRRDAAQVMERFGWTRYAPGRSTAATQTAVIDLAQMPTAFLPAFAPEPLEPGSDSPLTTVETGEPEPDSRPTLDEDAFRSGYTMEFPSFAEILRQTKAKAAVR